MMPLIRRAPACEGTRKIRGRIRAAASVPRSPDTWDAARHDPRQPAPEEGSSTSRAPSVASPAPPRPPSELLLQEQQRWQEHAQAELTRAREQEEMAGRDAGFAEGRAQAEAAFRERLGRMDAVLAGVARAVEQQVSGLEDLAVAVGFEMACKLLGEQMVGRDGVRALVEQALAKVNTQESVVLRLSPRDFSLLLQPGCADTPLRVPQRLELVPDERIELGGCLIETATGSLDARLQTQIDALRQVLLDVQRRR